MLTAEEALERLKKGNERFVSGQTQHLKLLTHQERAAMAESQEPFAIILGCSDSRVPAEMVFDQGLGDLFVIRVAGNIVAPSQVGSVEFAADSFGCPLVIVLGHTHCGAIHSTIEALMNPATPPSANLMSIVNRVRPSVEILLQTELKDDLDKLSVHAVRSNVFASVNQLRHGSAVLENLIAQGKLKVVGAEYSLETGKVSFYDF
ncbi:carbonic anhydrase [Acinetobacter cumulans]|jgi:carbonic anhydrase|uniref:carbonic anhydrase n=1 Tax=Acinetobacter cumulans TaxID=2136182 RepID=A0A3A8G122_9GAMM|nr:MULTISPECIES: carbonic anhydrase [Acinetobacter]NWK76019.1 carbonic anhydrase [Acinetobacter sp. SwsAc6]QCO21475.1 carbonic anhydrase [Acinetobacter cumulans]RKG40271.1 carbonic anhydrase [Acinetobacter cumulans]RKG49202.1 carbonic anhydrase [Acinetobacter cumulans]RKG52745.1 carbonic anhydrase [Acinetobacter cumulans]